MKDLIVLVADGDAEATLRTLLTRRTGSLHIRKFEDQAFDIIRHPRRDPGVCREGVELLRQSNRLYRHALIVVDREGSGFERLSAEELENQLDEALRVSGWDDRAATIVLDPELERWIWVRSRNLPEVLGVSEDQFEELLGSLALDSIGKPICPKEALITMLGRSGRPFSPAIFREVAERVSLSRCGDRAFLRLKELLQSWFPPN